MVGGEYGVTGGDPSRVVFCHRRAQYVPFWRHYGRRGQYFCRNRERQLQRDDHPGGHPKNGGTSQRTRLGLWLFGRDCHAAHRLFRLYRRRPLWARLGKRHRHSSHCRGVSSVDTAFRYSHPRRRSRSTRRDVTSPHRTHSRIRRAVSRYRTALSRRQTDVLVSLRERHFSRRARRSVYLRRSAGRHHLWLLTR